MVVTLRDVAKKAGVSIGTVSHILNGKEREIRISDATCGKVWDIARELNYKPNAFARSLRTRKSNTIGVCAAYLQDLYTATILQYVSRHAYDIGYRLMLSFIEEREDPVQAVHSAFGQGAVDGILIRDSRMDDKSIIKLHNDGIHMVLIGREISGMPIPAVFYDNFMGGRLAAEHLLNLGHEKIIAVITNNSMGRARFEGACSVFDNNKRPDVLFADFSAPEEIPRVGYDIGGKLAGMHDRPTAVVVVGDLLAFGIILALKEHGIRVPEDIAIVGFDDMTNVSAYYDPPLTSVRPPYSEMGETAVNLLVDLIEGRAEPGADTRIMLNPTLVARRSSGAAGWYVP